MTHSYGNLDGAHDGARLRLQRREFAAVDGYMCVTRLIYMCNMLIHTCNILIFMCVTRIHMETWMVPTEVPDLRCSNVCDITQTYA